MSSSHDEYSFDGECKLSEDADFTLTFDDESHLKVPKSLLEMTSPVLKTEIRDCQHDGSLHLPKTSKNVWVVILNYLHPLGTCGTYLNRITKKCSDELIDVLKQCQKYGFTSLKEVLDEKLASKFDKHPWISFCSRGGEVYAYRRAYYDKTLIRAIISFDLPKSEEALVSYLVEILTDNEQLLKNRIEAKQKPNEQSMKRSISSVEEILDQLDQNECYKVCSRFAKRMLANKICLSVDYINFKRL